MAPPRGPRGSLSSPRGSRGSLSSPQGSRGSWPSPSGSSQQKPPPKIYTMKDSGSGQKKPTPPPCQLVQDFEDSVADAMRAAVPKNRDAANTKFAPRIEYGKRGRDVVVWSNHFVINITDPGLVLHVYRIKLPLVKIRDQEQEISGRKRAQIVKLLLEQSKDLQGDNGGMDIVTDFHSMLISKRDLTGKIGATVIYRNEDEKQAAAKPPSYEVEIEKDEDQPELHLESFIQHMQSRVITKPSFGTLVQALNIFLNFHAKTKEDLATMGPRNVFSFSDNNNATSLGGGAVAMSGYYSSVRPAGRRFLANVDLSCAAFHDPQIELSKLAEMWPGDVSGLDQFLHFVRIKTRHMAPNKVKTICGLAKPSDGQPVGPKSTAPPHPPRGEKDGNTFRDIELGAGPKRVHFWMEDSKGEGRYISVWNFFREHYKLEADANIPVVNVGSQKQPVYLPAEACQVQRGQSVKSILNPNQTAKMVQIACKSPADTFNAIRPQGARTVGLASGFNPRLAHFGIETDSPLLTVHARFLPRPNIHYHPANRNMPPSDTRGLVSLREDAAWNLASRRVIRSGRMSRWRCLMLCRTNSDEKKNIESGLFAAFSRQSITAAKAMPSLEQDSFKLSDGNSVSQLHQSLQKQAQELDMLVIVLENDNKVVYNMIKSIGDVQQGLVTQCIVRGRATKQSGSSQAQYFDNVALKVNMKLRGENHLVNSPACRFIRQDETLIIGADVTHPGGPSGGQLSFAALVGLTSPNQGQYVARFSVQEGGQEMIDGIGGMFSELLRLWKLRHNGKLPKNVVYLRDGLSEGQFEKLYDEEVAKLREAYGKFAPGPGAALCVFAASVQKRHHKRFAPTREEDADKTGNCKAGLVVDRGITEPRHLEFYLQAHTVIKGTARPIHVFVVCDEVTRKMEPAVLNDFMRNKSDFIQSLVHDLCWDFGRTTRAVSLPAPVFYAHLAADRARRYIAEESRKNNGAVKAVTAKKLLEVHTQLRDTMFFV